MVVALVVALVELSDTKQIIRKMADSEDEKEAQLRAEAWRNN